MITLRAFALTLTAAALTLSGSAGADEAKAKAKAKKKGPDLEAVFAKLDADNDGKLSPAEFTKLTEVMKKPKAEDAAAPKKPAKAGKGGKKLTALFEKLDADKNGSLSKDEFKKLPEVRKELKKDKKK